MKTLISLVGPTGIGKTKWSLEMARRFGLPVIGADSVQIYRGLDIGSGKVTAEEMGEVAHHMIDVVDPCEDFSAGDYGRAVEGLLPDLLGKHDAALLVGGSGFYLQAVWDGLDDMPPVDLKVREQLNQEFAEVGLIPLVQELRKVDLASFDSIDRRNPMRVIRALEVFRSSGTPISEFRQRSADRPPKPYRELRIGLEMEREALYAQINERVETMMTEGQLEEVRGLVKEHGADCKGLLSVGYRELVSHFNGEYDLAEATRLIKRNHRRYAKRQMTWFRRYDNIQWFHPSQLADAIQLVESQLKAQ